MAVDRRRRASQLLGARQGDRIEGRRAARYRSTCLWQPDCRACQEGAAFPLADLLRRSVYSRLPDYEDVNDAERLSKDPTFRPIGSKKAMERGAALTYRLRSLEIE